MFKKEQSHTMGADLSALYVAMDVGSHGIGYRG